MKCLTLVFSCWMLTPMTRRRMEQTLTWILRERASVLWSRPLRARWDPCAQLGVRSSEKGLLLVWLVLLTSISFLQTYFLPVIGLVDAEKLKPGDLVVSDAVVTVRDDVGQKITYVSLFRKETNLSRLHQDHFCTKILIKRYYGFSHICSIEK